MKWCLLTVSIAALLQSSICSGNWEKSSNGVGYELVQSRLDKMQLKLTELVEKFEVLLNQQVSTNKHIKELTTSLGSRSCSGHFKLDTSIPTGCVTIRSYFADKYLAVSSNYDSQRRQVALQSNPEQWTLVRESGFYRITRRQGQEDLYAAMEDLAYDGQRRRIFTWIPGFGDNQGKWEIEEAAGFAGMVHIRAGYFGEYLYAADFDNQVFTWIPKGAPGKDSQYLWQIEQC